MTIRELRSEVESLKKQIPTNSDSTIRVFLGNLPDGHCARLASLCAYLAGDNWFKDVVPTYLADDSLMQSFRGYMFVIKTFSSDKATQEAAQWILDNEVSTVFGLRTES